MKHNIKLWQLKKLVDEKYSMTKILKKFNPNNYYTAGRPCFCPFHLNEDTPAAAIYNNDGKETLYCFSEKRLYKPSDALEKLLNYDIYEVGMRLWNSLTDMEKETFLMENQSLDDIANLFSEETKENKKEDIDLEKTKLLYKKHKLSLSALLDKYLEKNIN